MSLRILFLLSLLFSSLTLRAATISGTFAVSDTTGSVTLVQMNYDTRNDSIVKRTSVGTNKKFSIMLSLKEPALYNLQDANGKSLLYLVVKPQDNITLDLTSAQISVKGSAETQYLLDYEARRKELYNKWLKPVYDSSAAAEKANDKAKLEYWNQQQPAALDAYRGGLSTWASQPFFIQSLAAIHHSLRWNPDNDLALMDTMLAAYHKLYSGYTLTKQLENKVARTKRIAMGATAPDFQSATPEGKIIDLKTTRGQYVLLDFWASWCPPCRQESPTLVRLYNAYKEKGFTIVSVSVDDDKQKWTKAIAKDLYTWTNVSELKGWKSPTAALYSVSSIPANFLLDPQGRIIAKNLRGEALEIKLKEVLK